MTWEAVGWVVTEFWVWLYSPGFRILTLLYPFSIFRPQWQKSMLVFCFKASKHYAYPGYFTLGGLDEN